MKKLLAVMVTALLLSGCGAAARESGFYEHKTVYKNWDHMKFSICGYKKADPKAAEQSAEQEWWGVDIEEPRQ